MLFRMAFALALVLPFLASGCSGVSVQADEPERPLPPSVERVVIVPDASWMREDPGALVFLGQVVAQLRVRSAVRDYGVGFVLADDRVADGKGLAPGKDALWTVTRCDFNPRASTRHTSPGAGAAPELEDEARASAGRLDATAVDPGPVGPSVTRSFSFSLRGWIKTPGDDLARGSPRPAGRGALPTPEEHPLRVVSRVAISGDCDFDEAIGHDDEGLWYRDSLAKIADAILDHLPRRPLKPGEVEDDPLEEPIHGGMVPGEPMPGELKPQDSPAENIPGIEGPVHGELGENR